MLPPKEKESVQISIHWVGKAAISTEFSHPHAMNSLISDAKSGADEGYWAETSAIHINQQHLRRLYTKVNLRGNNCFDQKTPMPASGSWINLTFGFKFRNVCWELTIAMHTMPQPSFHSFVLVRIIEAALHFFQYGWQIFYSVGELSADVALLDRGHQVLTATATMLLIMMSSQRKNFCRQ